MHMILVALFAVGAFADSGVLVNHYNFDVSADPFIKPSYGLPQAEYGLPHAEYGPPIETPKYAPYPAAKVVVPHSEYGVPVEQPKVIAPVVTQYDYKLETPVAPYPAKVAVPYAVYGPPVEQPKVYAAPVVSKYNFEIPAEVKYTPYPAAVKVAPYPARIETPHEVYGVPF